MIVEYDSIRRVTKEVVDAGNQTYTFAYTSSSFSNDYNQWQTKTVEGLPNGAENIVYSNYAGQTMLKVYQSGSDKWYVFHKYNASGNLIMTAESSAITGYDETSPDLLKYVSGSYTYLNSTGLIYTYQYYTTTSSGGVAGYLQYSQVQQGQSSTPTIVREYQYTSQTVGGSTIYKRSKVVCYPSSTDQTIQLNCVIYSYTWYSGTFQVQQQTTTWPTVATTQNGSGSANSRNQYFDPYGLLIWTRDERGFLTNYTWDLSRGGITQRIDDVNTSLVSAPSGTGWTTPSGGGLHLITDIELDNQGRLIQELGPSHTVDIGGTATPVRRARWGIYLDASQMVYEGAGYATGSGTYAYTLVNPVKVIQLDHIGRMVDEIMATRSSVSGALSASDTFAQSTWVRWNHNNYDNSGLLTYQRKYHLIPSSGSGSSGTNYDETDYTYDSMEELLRQESPGGTITRLVYDERERVASVWVGTNDTGATASNPAGSGSPNNMVQVVAYQYDGGATGGDDNLTQQTLYDGSSTRATAYGYDYRDRLISKDGEIDFYEAYAYDNLDRVTQVDRKNTTSSGALVARTQTKYDDAGRVYQRLVYSVASGTAGNTLVEKFWYDPSGNLMKHVPLGTQVFEKKQFDGLNRVIASYLCYNTSEADTNYSAAGAITGDTVLNQTELTYDACSNLIQTTSRDRFHNATGTGALTTPGGSQPKARVSYKAVYPDAIGRMQASADFGTNAASSFTRPTTIPSGSATVLVTSVAYNNRGEAYKQTDPAATVNQRMFDDAGRQKQLTENVTGGSGPDQNRVTNYTYNADGRLATLTAVNSVTGDQVTTWQYGTTLSTSGVASNDLLSAKQLPDNVSGSDQVTYKYNRLGQVTEVDDQMGSVRMLVYDALGRPQHDRVTALGSGVDGTVLRVSRAYEVRGMLTGLTSYNNATVGSGSVVNDVQYVYNGFGQLVTEYQSHSGAVNTSTSPKVQYAYANGSSGYARRTSMTSPDSTLIGYGYGSSGASSDVLNRIEQITNGSTVLASYSFLGANKPVITTYPEVS
jgi:YD repeat-containing protein